MEKGSEYDQMSIKQGIEKHGTEAIAAVIKEYEQLRDMDTVTPINSDELSAMEKRGALELLTLIKKKRCGKITGRFCANGRKKKLHKKG